MIFQGHTFVNGIEGHLLTNKISMSVGYRYESNVVVPSKIFRNPAKHIDMAFQQPRSPNAYLWYDLAIHQMY